MIEEGQILRAGELLRQAAPPGSGVYVFGSHARGDAGPDSDVDFLVVEPELKDQHGEMVRLRDALRPLRLPADVVVTSRETFEAWRDTPNNLLHDAAREGRALHEVG